MITFDRQDLELLIVRLQLSTETTTKKNPLGQTLTRLRSPSTSPPPLLDDVLDYSSVATMFSLSLISRSEGFFMLKIKTKGNCCLGSLFNNLNVHMTTPDTLGINSTGIQGTLIFRIASYQLPFPVNKSQRKESMRSE